MTPSRIKKKQQSSGKRRSHKPPSLIKIKNCLVRVKRLKSFNLRMRKVNAVEQKRIISNKKFNPIEKRNEIRIIKAVSNVSKTVSKNNEKVKSNISLTKWKSSESSDEEILKPLNSMKSTQWQNTRYPQKMTESSPSDGRNIKKTMEKKSTEIKNTKKSVESKVVEETPMRSKRTPKPNRKYLNDSLITSFKKVDKVSRKFEAALSDSDSGNDIDNASSSDVDSDILRESDDSSVIEDYGRRSKAKTKPNFTTGNRKSTNLTPAMKQKLINEAMEKNKLNQHKVNQGYKTISSIKRDTDSIPGKTIILNKYSYNQNNQSLSERNVLPKAVIERSQKIRQMSLANANLNMIRKRKLNEQLQQQRQLVKKPRVIEKSNFKNVIDLNSDIDLNDDDEDADNTDIEDFIKELTAQKQIKVVKKPTPQQPIKKINQNIQSIPIATRKPTILNKNLQQSQSKETINESKRKNMQQSTKILNKNFENESAESIVDSDKEPSEKGNEGNTFDSSTLEDFEKMPTFTIVNINDIIGKKGDFTFEKHGADPLKSKDKSGSADSSDENVPTRKKTGSPAGYSSQTSIAHRSRRKAMHTNLLSENVDKNKVPPPRTPFPPPRKSTINKATQLKNKSTANQSNMKILNSSLKLSKSVTSNKRESLISSHNKSSNKGPPRILNSMVAKKTIPITTFNTKVGTRRSNDLSDSDNEKLDRSKLSKENNILKNQLFKKTDENKLENKNQSTPPVSGNKRKLPSEKVIIQRQGNKIIKKITCFETWYVINLPAETIEKENTIRNIVDVPLIQLANRAKSVNLPNSKWTCKVSLQKCTTAMMSRNINDEPYTGDIYDDYIDPNELHKYRPTNVMFRRQALHPTPKVPYDRAVIFKNNTFFTNIEGKNVKLIGAPHQIEQLNDIEILLNLVDDFSLKNQFIEQAPYVP